MADLTQTIEEIEEEIRKTPYHKGTEHHVGKLRARLARLKDRQLEGVSKSKGSGAVGYAVKKQGDATVVLIGAPSVGKSTLINRLTNAESKVAPYAFTTVSVIPGMLKYNDAYIQILDVPGLIEGARLGKGRGKEVLSVARGADLLLIMTDVERVNSLDNLTHELEDAGIRLDKVPPEVRIDKKAGGGLNIQSNIKQVINKDTIKEVAGEFGLRNADITIKEKLTLERLIDAFSSSRVYIPSIFVINKSDLTQSNGSTTKAVTHPSTNYLSISAQNGSGLDKLREAIWKSLRLVRIYLVRPDDEPGMNNPIVMKEETTLADVAEKLGSDFSENKSLAKIWGPGAHFPGQEVSLTTKVREGLQVRFLV